MRKVEFSIGGSITRARDAAYIVGDEDPLETLIDAALQSISTDVEITVGGVTMHLAAWQDPDMWSEDWREKDIDLDDVPGLVAAAAIQG